MQKETEEQKKLHAEAAQSADRRWARENALMDVMQKHKLTLPRNQAEWRVASGPDGEDLRGELVGILVGEVKVLCTDGLLAYFLLGDGETVVYGHLANLKAAKREDGGPRRADGKPKAPRKGVSLALEYLNEQMNKL